MDDFFHFVSKVVIILPFVIVIAALVLKFNQKENYSQKIIPSPTVVATKIPVSSPSVKLNLIGPFVCQINEKEASISAYIKDKKVFVERSEGEKVDYFLLKDDCLYWWQKGKYTGQKICGIGPYLSYFEQFSNFSNFGALGMGDFNLTSLLGGCKKEEIKDPKIFKLPNNVLFRNKNQ